MTLGNGIGMAALAIALIGAFFPFIGLFIGWVALIIACVAALFGDKGYTIATVIISAFAFLFFTPSLWLEAAAQGQPGGYSPVLRIVSMILVIAPIASMIAFATGKVAFSKSSQLPNP